MKVRKKLVPPKSALKQFSVQGIRHIETSQLVCKANEMTHLYIKRDFTDGNLISCEMSTVLVVPGRNSASLVMVIRSS